MAYFMTKRDSAPLALGISRSTPELKKLKSPPPQILAPPHDLAPKTYICDVWAMNGTLQDVQAQIEIRLSDIATGALRKEKSMGVQSLLSNRTTELLEDLSVDDKTAVQAIMRDGDGHVIARASDWPQPLKYVTLCASPDVNVSVLDGKLEIRTNVPVKGLVVSVVPDDRDVEFEDNAVDIFPDDVYTIRARGLTKADKVEVRYYGSDF